VDTSLTSLTSADALPNATASDASLSSTPQPGPRSLGPGVP
jgi:hypothetical protein